MAEIKIEKKKPIWPWVLLIIILLAVIAYFVYANNESDDYEDDVDTTEMDDMNYEDTQDTIDYGEAKEYSDSPDEVMTYGESIQDSTRIGIDSMYTKKALYNLSKAVTAKAAQYNINTSKALEDLKMYTTNMDSMSDSRMSSETATLSKNLKTWSMNITSVLESIQLKSFPTLNQDIANLKQTSSELTTATIDKQQKTLQAFLRKSNEVLNKMNS